tara:strand:+ start:600 stop:917 length:318 start_codon:yes stop_codon:yes gene_type:complete
MTELRYIKAFMHDGPLSRRILSLGVCIYLIENAEVSTNELAEYFDVDVVSVTYAIGNMQRAGWLIRTGWSNTRGLALDSRTGKLTKTSINSGIYSATDKLKDLMK